MRAQSNLSVVLALLCTVFLGTLMPGCRSHQQSGREMALLRAEILDLEDQFYALKSRYEATNQELRACRGGTLSSPNGEIIDESYIDRDCCPIDGYQGTEYIQESYLDSGSGLSPEGVVYDSPQHTGRYLADQKSSLRESARNLFRRNNTRIQSAQPRAQKMRGLGLLGGAPNLFRRNRQSADDSTEVITDFDIVIPETENYAPLSDEQFSSTQAPTMADPTTKRLVNPDSMVSKTKTTHPTFETNPLGLDLTIDDGMSVEDSRPDNINIDVPMDGIGNSGHSEAGGHNREPVTQIFIDSDATHGEDVDGKPGDEGLVLLIQPRNQRGQVVNESGEITISLMEPSANGAEQRIGLWKFTPEEIRLFALNNQNRQQGFLLHLPWENNIPKTNELLLYVRYWTIDGRRLESSLPLSIDPPKSDYTVDGPLIEGWTKRDPRWNRGIQAPVIPSQRSMLADDLNDPHRGGGNQPSSGRGVKASPASTKIKRPAWRPVR